MALAQAGGCEPTRTSTDDPAAERAAQERGASTNAGLASSDTPTPSASARPASSVSADSSSASGASSSGATDAELAPCPPGTALIEGGVLEVLERGDEVRIASYCIDQHEVTVSSFRAAALTRPTLRDCAGERSCTPLPSRTDWGDPSEDARSSRWCSGVRAGADDEPVVCVSIDEARAYCAERGARLPSGDEWEWAARGTRRRTPWGAPLATGGEACWSRPEPRSGPCSVGAYPNDRSPEGVIDLGGNASEWVEPPARARGTKGRWAYGASWYAIDDGYFGAALGGFETPARRAETIGFRCAAAPTSSR